MKKTRKKLKCHGDKINLVALTLNTKEVCGQLNGWTGVVTNPKRFYKPGFEISR